MGMQLVEGSVVQTCLRKANIGQPLEGIVVCVSRQVVQITINGQVFTLKKGRGQHMTCSTDFDRGVSLEDLEAFARQVIKMTSNLYPKRRNSHLHPSSPCKDHYPPPQQNRGKRGL